MRLIDADALLEKLKSEWAFLSHDDYVQEVTNAPAIEGEAVLLGNMQNSPEAVQAYIRQSMPNISKELVALMTRPSIQECVTRFLRWKLPKDFSPDAGISFERVFNKDTPYEMEHSPTGTNLLDAVQAKEMIEHILAGAHIELSPPQPQPVREALEEAAKIAEKYEPDEKQDYIDYASR